MLARIEAVGRHVPTGLVYAEVSYWPGPDVSGDPALRNDFLVEVHATATVIKTDSAGRYVTRSGQALIPFVELGDDWQPRPEDPADPWAREIVSLNQPVQLLAEVVAYGQRSARTVGDQRGVHPADVNTDGLHPDLAALVGQVVTVD